MAFNVQNFVRENVKAMKAYSSARDEFKDAYGAQVFIDANENPNETGLNRYPDPNQSTLKRLISRIKNIPEDNILLGNGSDEVLDLIFRAFLEPKEDQIITNPPTYGMYKVLANLNNISVREVLLTHDFQLDVDQIINAIGTQTKAVFVCSPNNPTGNLMRFEDIEKILAHDVLVVIDEAYIDFANQQSWINFMQHYPNLIVIQTLSKAFGLAGIRLGMCFANTNIIEILKKIKMPYNVNTLTQDKAIEMISDQGLISNQIKNILDQRAYLIHALEEISYVEKIYPTNANFVLIKVDDANKKYQDLVDRGIVVRNRTNEPLCHNCLRLTVGTKTENIKLIETLKALV